MSDFISKIPFFRLLLPAIAAILFASFGGEIAYPWLICALGAIAAIVSCFIQERKQFLFRWLFGAGIFVFIFGFLSMVYGYRDRQSAFDFPPRPTTYIGIVTDIPQAKPRSFACNVKVTYPAGKKIVVYLQKENEARNIMPGDEIVFNAQIQPFKNLGNPDDFNYARFMRNKGFSGSAYLSSVNWRKTGNSHFSLYILAQRVRAAALKFYRQFGLDDDAYSFIAALTLGYKQDLSDDMQEAFRASGTSHVLAVSGLHVSIIYAVFVFLFSFLGRDTKGFIFRQLLIIAALWMYAFLTGFSASVVRATIMLSIVSVGLAQQKKGFTYNTLAAAALVILAYSPQSFFDVGFQMSFTAVFFILYFQPKLLTFYRPRNKVLQYIRDLFTVSVAAQLGLFPVVLYYFGTFPTYFFIANMLVVPLVIVIINVCVPLVVITLAASSEFQVVDILFRIFQWVINLLIDIVLGVVYWIESLPFSQITNSYISMPQAILTVALLIGFTEFMMRKRAGTLIVSLVGVLLLVLSFTYSATWVEPPRLVVFNKQGFSDIGFYVNDRRRYFDMEKNGFIPHGQKTILRLSENKYKQLKAEKPFEVDVLILSEDKTFRIKDLNNVFRAKQIVLDSSIPQYVKNYLIRDCRNLGISVHDVSQDGAYSVNF